MESSLYFVCDSRQENDDTDSNDGGKGRCSLDSSKSKLIEAQKIQILNESSNFYTAANCLKMATSDTAHDIYAADVLYHKSCCNKFIYIFYCSRSIKGNNKKRRATKTRKLLEDFAS